jgi:ectoine hydroxylase-related dioxygenase (phytanoyl-CoA dioxygenase family)
MLEEKVAAAPARLTEAQKASFAANGYLVVRNALSPEDCARWIAVVEALDTGERAARGLDGAEFVEIRNAIARDARILELLTWPTTFPLIAELMGPDLQVNTTHTMVRPPQPVETAAAYKRIDWHRDGAADMPLVNGAYPWLYTKVGYFLTDLSRPWMGGLRVLPGSHRNADRPKPREGQVDPPGALEVTTQAGDAVIFAQPLYHSVGPNVSRVTRKNIYVGYSRRWVRPLDYFEQSPELLAQATPIERQLLGARGSEMTYWLPKPEETPLRAWLADHLARTTP